MNNNLIIKDMKIIKNSRREIIKYNKQMHMKLYRIVERLFLKKYNNRIIIIIILEGLIIIIIINIIINIIKVYNKVHVLEIKNHHHLYKYHKNQIF